MKVSAQVKILMLMPLLIVLAAVPALAAENWAADPKTGCQVCFITGANYTLMAAGWSGPVVDGKAEGKGKLKLTLQDKDGKKFSGKADAEMKQGKLNGAVELKWSDGESFRGFCKDGRYEGKGVLKNSNGDVYEGDFKEGLRDGQGVMKFKNGDVYEGAYKDNQPNGHGVLKYKKSGDVYEGVYQNGVRNGRGIYRWKNGRVYEGGFTEQGRNGYGVYKNKAGQIIYEGLWKDDRIISMNDPEKFIII